MYADAFYEAFAERRPRSFHRADKAAAASRNASFSVREADGLLNIGVFLGGVVLP